MLESTEFYSSYEIGMFMFVLFCVTPQRIVVIFVTYGREYFIFDKCKVRTRNLVIFYVQSDLGLLSFIFCVCDLL